MLSPVPLVKLARYDGLTMLCPNRYPAAPNSIGMNASPGGRL